MVLRFLALMAAFLFLSGCGDASSVGVIGGADGPTAIFVSGNSFPLIVVVAAAVVLVVLLAVVFPGRGR
ncbi:MAG: sodium ion-translocating decarboxylase subunit beta, partial [Clostridia bacterium]|nr:sodium ion-translocating decarboxylase subunit beta [Clostridia bacterium]